VIHRSYAPSVNGWSKRFIIWHGIVSPRRAR